MNIGNLKEKFPYIELEELFQYFPRISLAEYPLLGEYSWEECHQGFIGAGGLFLVSEVAQKMALKPGMRVLDLCCGNSSSSIYLAKHFAVNVIAVDLNADLVQNQDRINQADLSEMITPIVMDACDFQFPNEYFDAVFCLNSYFYIGADNDYLPYLAKFLIPGGRIGIASPCYADELTPHTPREFLYDAPDFVESYSVHSPKWWFDHFEKTGLVDILICEDHPKGREFWLDDVRWLLESSYSKDMGAIMREMVLQQIIMLLTDEERFVTYLTIIAEKKDEN